MPHTRIGGYPKRADSLHTIRSAFSTMLVPPAMHQPCTAAIVGFEIVCSFAHVAAYRPIICTSATESHTRVLAASASACPAVAQSSW